MSDSTTTSTHRPDTVGKPPAGMAWALGLAVGALLVGAVYLILVRGEVILQDLSALSGYIFCY